MPRRVVRSLFRGESDQPPQLRLEGQVEADKNVRLDVVVSGTTTRNPSNLIKDLTSLGSSGDYFVVQIRDALVFLKDEFVKAFRMTDGVELTVTDNTPGGSFGSYLQNPDTGALLPNTDLVAAVKVDTAFIANRLKTPKILTGWTYQQIMNFIELGDEDGTGATTIVDGTDDPVDKFSDLPNGGTPAPSDGDVHRVLIDENNDFHGIYLRFTGTPSASFPVGFYPNHDGWYRIPIAGQAEARWDLTTMPHLMTYDEDANTVTFDQVPWRQRLSGNTATNKVSSLKDSPVIDTQFQASRIMFFLRNQLVGSQSNDFFNLWLRNAGVPVDEDRIDLDLAIYKNLGRPLRAAVLGHSMLMGFENGQLAFGSGTNNLTSINGTFRVISNFSTDDVIMGDAGELGYLVDKQGYIHQFAVIESGGISRIAYSAWANIHRSRNLHGLTPTRLFAADRTLMIETTDGKLIVFDLFSVQGKTIQAAWSELTFFADTIHVAKWDDRLYLVQQDATGFSIVDYEHRNAEAPTGMLYPPTLDRMELVTGAHDAVANETTFSHTGRNGDLLTSKLVIRPPSTAHHIPKLLSVATDGTVIFDGGSGVDGDWDASDPHFLGFAFTSEIELSEFWPALDEAVASVQFLTVHHFETSDYKVIFPQHDQEDIEGEFEARRLPFTTGQPTVDTGFKRFETPFDGQRTRPIIRSSSPGQFTIIGLGYDYTLQESE